MADINVVKEWEDGEQKVWVSEPTRIRGETGSERRTGISQKRGLETVEEQKAAKARLAVPDSLTDKARGRTQGGQF